MKIKSKVIKSKRYPTSGVFYGSKVDGITEMQEAEDTLWQGKYKFMIRTGTVLEGKTKPQWDTLRWYYKDIETANRKFDERVNDLVTISSIENSLPEL